MLIDRRLTASRIMVLLLLAYVVVTGSALLPRTLPEHEFAHALVSLLLVIIGASGRVRASLYRGGRKNATLVQDGPYSLCRNRYRAATPRSFTRFGRYRSDPAITVYPHQVLKALIGVAPLKGFS